MKIKKLLCAALLIGSTSLAFAAGDFPESFEHTLFYFKKGVLTDLTATMQLQKVSVRGPEFEVLLRNGNNDIPLDSSRFSDIQTYMGTVDGYPGAVAFALRKKDGNVLSMITFDRGETWISEDPYGDLGGAAFKPEDFTNIDLQTFDEIYMPESGPETGIGRTLSPNQVGQDVYQFNVGVETSYDFYRQKNSDPEHVLELIEFSVLNAAVPFIRDAKLFPKIGRVIIRTSLSGDHWNAANGSSADYVDSLIAAWKNNEADTDWLHVTGAAKDVAPGLARIDGSVNFMTSEGNFGISLRHEMAHSWFLGHLDGSPGGKNWGPEGPTMNSGNYFVRFSGKEVTRMMYRRDVGGGKADGPWVNRCNNIGNFSEVPLPPYAAMDVASVDPSDQILIDVLANDHDANGNSLSLHDYDRSSDRNGTIVRQGGRLLYTAPSRQGEDYFKYAVIDSTGKIAEGVVVLDVITGGSTTGGNSPVFTTNTITKPDAVIGSAYAGQSLAGNATDVDGDPLTFSKVSGPDWLTVSSNGALSGTPGILDEGVNTWDVQVADGDGTDTAILEINVQSGGNQTVVSLRNGSSGYNGMIDASIRSDNATTNYGSAGTLEIDGSPDYAGLLKWDLSAIPAGSTVVSATLGVQVSNISSNTYEVYGLKKSWVESQVTWNQAANGSNWQIAGVNGSNDRGSTVLVSITAPSLGWYDLSLNAAGIAQVQSWIDNPSSNQGFIILDYGNSNGLDIYSSEHGTVSQRPMLTITYTDGGTSGGSRPVFASDTIIKPAATEGTFYNGQTLAGSATDADGDTLTFAKMDGPGWLNVTANGSLSGTPSAGDAGVNRWTVQVADGIDGTDTATLEINVQPAGLGSDDTCPGIDLGDVSSTTVPSTLSGSIQQGSDDADYFSVTATESGTLTLTQTPTNSRVVSFSVGTACGNDNVFTRVNNRRVKTASVNVAAGQTIYFWMDTSGYSNTNERAYNISFDFR